MTLSICIKNWLTAFRIPFTTVALIPFAVGFIWALSKGEKVSYLMLFLGEAAIFMICVSCHLFGEIFDQAEDRKTVIYGRSKFAGGTLMIAQGHIRPLYAAIAALLFLGFAFLCGLIITIYYNSLLLFFMGAFGAAVAVLYSVPPFRLVKRGLGELFIGVCYGWLTLTTGYFVASGLFPSDSFLMCLPIALTVFNIILINEFPDYQADKEEGKRNLMVRFGKESSALIYAFSNILILISFLIIYFFLYKSISAFIFLLIPTLFLSIFLTNGLVLRKNWKEPEKLENLCALTIIHNHICSITLAALFLCI